ncbi:MAG: MurT ligase domain-containing protein [Bifidobacteriaceae bacterium]|nr:MurT ligase domain-containing protein [Bifidobacteriaceae bacterium]
MAAHALIPKALTPALGKAVRAAARLHGGGTAFPGKVVERLDPGFMARTLAQLPYGVVLVSGTNGKTTTTRIVASVLESLGLRVFTNPTGSNFTRGVVSALLDKVSMGGRLDADIAVLELDEAYAVHFVRRVKPRYTLLLNVMRDQLDRFGEIDNTARLLGKAAAATTGTLVLNREDPRIAALAGLAPRGTAVRYFGLDESLRRFFPTDDSMHCELASDGENRENRGDKEDGAAEAAAGAEAGAGTVGAGTAGANNAGAAADSAAEQLPADVTLMAVDGNSATFRMDGEQYDATLKLEGVYNLFNAAAAMAVARAVMDDVEEKRLARGMAGRSATIRTIDNRAADNRVADQDAVKQPASTQPAAKQSATKQSAANQPDDAADRRLIEAISAVTPAFGRGETIEVNGVPVELILVKNPMGFRLALTSFPAEGHGTMIVINDQYADGRDMSWLWDVDFTSLRGTGVDMVSGVRATDMALRLAYDGVEARSIDEDIDRAVARFLAGNPTQPKHIYCTYTAMLAVRKRVATFTHVEDAGL